MPRRGCCVLVEDERPESGGGEGPSDHPFEAEYGDHFETQTDALRDVAPLLRALATALGKKPAELRIYDPYYCSGGVKKGWREVGFPRCANENVDCYAVWQSGDVPAHDILITNPPFSGQHKEWCLSHCAASRKPWLVLLPNYCANKEYFSRVVKQHGARPWFAAPEESYAFRHPEDTGKPESPFYSVWIADFGRHNEAVLAEYARQPVRALRIQRSVAELQSSGLTPSWKRPNPRQRKAMKRKREE
eukprot:TRINITY_DN21811_c0_g1_i1.p1 TRINITY_DN21811_c0_g1~~TRINITY_DN21811_c0_g1_i1.p1  ORF type:complete len:247 (+),score=79.39 TRINITY_DN21811_c0_g1_i1:54-794(+)